MASKRLLPLLARPSPLSSFLPPIRTPPPRLTHRPTLPPPHPHHLHKRPYSTTPPPAAPPKPYTFDQVQKLSKSKPPSVLLIDVREPSELAATGRIPGSVNVPLASNPDAFFLHGEEFFDRFGVRKPSPEPSPSTVRENEELGEEGEGEGEGVIKGAEVEEVVFYCKAGVRSRAAARLAGGEGGWSGVRVGEYAGSWDEWVGRGGEVER